MRALFECPTVEAFAERLQTVLWISGSQATAASGGRDGREEGHL